VSEKKYYWLKLKDDFFMQKEIKKLRKLAGGDTYTIIYLKLQLISIKNGGKIIFESVEDNFVDEMALTIDEEVENVRFTLLFLEKYNLI
jgi:predicted phage replisome organizer